MSRKEKKSVESKGWKFKKKRIGLLLSYREIGKKNTCRSFRPKSLNWRHILRNSYAQDVELPSLKIAPLKRTMRSRLKSSQKMR